MPVKTKPSFIDQVKENLPAAKVLVFCSSDILPLEWPRDENGVKRVTDAESIVVNGRERLMNKVVYRNIETTSPQRQRGEVGKLGYMELDLNDESHPTETDAEFLDRVKDWIANSKDPRVHTYNVSVAQDNPFPLPFDTWNNLKTSSLLEVIAAGYLGDDADKNAERLRQFAGYELNRRIEKRDDRGRVIEVLTTRQDVLDGIEWLASASGDESDDDMDIDDDSEDDDE